MKYFISIHGGSESTAWKNPQITKDYSFNYRPAPAYPRQIKNSSTIYETRVFLFRNPRDRKGPGNKRANNPFINFLSDDFSTRALLVPV